MESLKEVYFDKINEYMFLVIVMVKFKRYDEILLYIEKVKEEYNKFNEEKKNWEWV